jgi:myo-inositol-1(or 4)-monophosphatase
MNETHQGFLDAAIEAARIGGAILKEYKQRSAPISVGLKGLNDYVTEVDHASEKAILDYLTAKYPEHSIVAEESEELARDKRFQWYIDPLDGTTNFIHDVPIYAVSVALCVDGKPVVGAVYDPVHEEMFHAVAEGGAFLNQEKIVVSERESLKGSLLSTGFPFRAQGRLKEYMRSLETFILETAGVRRAGSASLDLCYTASGRYDGFWEMALSPWDIAAGVLIVREAGGVVTDFLGRDGYLKTGNVVTANRRIHSSMLEIIRHTMV